MIGFQYVGRRWVEFARGYSGYLVFIVNFATFVTVLYGLAPLIKESVQFSLFIALAVIFIVPTAILIGHIHFRKQYPIETFIAITKNPWTYKVVPNSKEIPSYEINLAILEQLHYTAETDEQRKKLDVAIKKCKNLLAGNDTREKVQ